MAELNGKIGIEDGLRIGELAGKYGADNIVSLRSIGQSVSEELPEGTAARTNLEAALEKVVYDDAAVDKVFKSIESNPEALKNIQHAALNAPEDAARVLELAVKGQTDSLDALMKGDFEKVDAILNPKPKPAFTKATGGSSATPEAELEEAEEAKAKSGIGALKAEDAKDVEAAGEDFSVQLLANLTDGMNKLGLSSEVQEQIIGFVTEIFEKFSGMFESFKSGNGGDLLKGFVGDKTQAVDPNTGEPLVSENDNAKGDPEMKAGLKPEPATGTTGVSPS
jgi:hypothetical protein